MHPSPKHHFNITQFQWERSTWFPLFLFFFSLKDLDPLCLSSTIKTNRVVEILIELIRFRAQGYCSSLWIRSDRIDNFFLALCLLICLWFPFCSLNLVCVRNLNRLISVVLVDDLSFLLWFSFDGCFRRSPSSRHCLIRLSEAFDYVLSALLPTSCMEERELSFGFCFCFFNRLFISYWTSKP